MDPFLKYLVESKQWLTAEDAAKVPANLKDDELDSFLVNRGLVKRGHLRRARLDHVQLVVDVMPEERGPEPSSGPAPRQREIPSDPEPAEDPGDAPAPGPRIGDYEVGAVIGRRRKLVSYRAHDRRTNEDLVLRVMRVPEGDVNLGLFVATQLPSVYGARRRLAAYRGIGAMGDLAWIARQHVEGSSLADLLGAGGAMDVAKVEAIAVALLQCVAQLHERGHLHGALHTNNVILRADGSTPVLTDYGLEPMFRPLQGRRRITPSDPPEVQAGEDPTSRSDMWQYALVCCEMLTGSIASVGTPGQPGGHSPATVFAAGLPMLPAGRLRELLEKCSSPDPLQRPLNGRAGLTLVNMPYLEEPSTEDEQPPVAVAPAGSAWQRWAMAAASVLVVGLACWRFWPTSEAHVDKPEPPPTVNKVEVRHTTAPDARAVTEQIGKLTRIEMPSSTCGEGCANALCAANRTAWQAWIRLQALRFELLDCTDSAKLRVFLAKVDSVTPSSLTFAGAVVPIPPGVRVPGDKVPQGLKDWFEVDILGRASNGEELPKLAGDLQTLGCLVELPDWYRADRVAAIAKLKNEYLGLSAADLVTRVRDVEGDPCWAKAGNLREAVGGRFASAEAWLKQEQRLKAAKVDSVADCLDFLGLLQQDRANTFARTAFRSFENKLLTAAAQKFANLKPVVIEVVAPNASAGRDRAQWGLDPKLLELAQQLARSESENLAPEGRRGEALWRQFDQRHQDWCNWLDHLDSLRRTHEAVATALQTVRSDAPLGVPTELEDWQKVRKDVESFLRDRNDAALHHAARDEMGEKLDHLGKAFLVFEAGRRIAPWGGIRSSDAQAVAAAPWKAHERLKDGWWPEVVDHGRAVDTQRGVPMVLLQAVKAPADAPKVWAYIDLDSCDQSLVDGRFANGASYSFDYILQEVQRVNRSGDQGASKWSLRLPYLEELAALAIEAKTVKVQPAPEFCQRRSSGSNIIDSHVVPSLCYLVGNWRYPDGMSPSLAQRLAAGPRLVEVDQSVTGVTFRFVRSMPRERS